MPSFQKKLTNMIWRCMGESILFSAAVMIILLYLLQKSGFLILPESWIDWILIGLALIAVNFVLGSAFGFWSSNRLKRRLEPLMESMIFLEKGDFSRFELELGEDEIGRLGEQLERIKKKWEEQVTSLQRLSNDNAQLADKVKYTAVIEERQRLARELHDAVSQQLFAISMTSTAVGRIIERDYDKAKRQISLIEEMASVAQSEMRALLMHLRPVHLEGKRLSEALAGLIQELRAKVQIAIDLEMDANVSLPKGIEDHLFRIVQEAISNALRHSRASKLEIKLLRRQNNVRLVIRDNGIGFNLENKNHASYGIVTMEERVNEIGGSFKIVTAPNQGTRIEIHVPIL